MDPKACLDRAEEALFAGDLEEVRAALSDYRAWRFAGGFEPRFGDRKAAVIQENLDAREEEASLKG